jgi:hypothetical protein
MTERIRRHFFEDFLAAHHMLHRKKTLIDFGKILFHARKEFENVDFHSRTAAP